MNDTPDVTSGPPDDNGRDPLAFIDEAVSEITPADVRKRLNETLRQADYQPARPDITDLEIGELLGCSQPGAQHELNWMLQQAANEFRDAHADRQEARLALAAARAEVSRSNAIVQQTQAYVDKALDEANQAVSDAKEKAERIVAEARTVADQIICGAHENAEQIISSARQEAENPVANAFHKEANCAGDARGLDPAGSSMGTRLEITHNLYSVSLNQYMLQHLSLVERQHLLVAELQSQLRSHLEEPIGLGDDSGREDPVRKLFVWYGPSRVARLSFPQGEPREVDALVVMACTGESFLDDAAQQKGEQDSFLPAPSTCIKAIQGKLETSALEAAGEVAERGSDLGPAGSAACDYEGRPDPTGARTPTELVAVLRQYRAWAGEPSCREMSQFTRGSSATAMREALHCDDLPRLKVMEAIVVGCGGSSEDLMRFVKAWLAIQTGAGPAVTRAVPDNRTTAR